MKLNYKCFGVNGNTYSEEVDTKALLTQVSSWDISPNNPKAIAYMRIEPLKMIAILKKMHALETELKEYKDLTSLMQEINKLES